MHVHPHLAHVHLYMYRCSVDSCCLHSLSHLFLKLGLCSLHEGLFYACKSTSWLVKTLHYMLLLHDFLHSESLGCCGLTSLLLLSESHPAVGFAQYSTPPHPVLQLMYSIIVLIGKSFLECRL